MKYMKQLLVILAFCLVGEVLAMLLPLPVPAAIYGFVLLFIALLTGLLKPGHIEKTARFLIDIMPILFVAPAVNILSCYDIIAPAVVPILLITAVSTAAVFFVAGRVTQWLCTREGKNHD